MTDMPGKKIDLPIPPVLTEAFGYAGNARFVGFYYVPDADDLIFDDGCSSGTAATWAFQAYRRHRAVGQLLHGTGIDDSPPTHWLLFDREAGRASIAPFAEARAFLEAQYPPPPPITPEEIEAIRRQAEEMIAKGWREVRVDPEQIRRAMDEQRGRVGRMMSWLDMAPTPPKNGRGT